MLAILVFSLGILALIGFQAGAVRLSGANMQRSQAVLVSNQIEAGLWGLAPTAIADCAGTYTAKSTTKCNINWQSALQSLPAAKAVVTINQQQVSIDLTWQMPGQKDASNHRHVTQISRN
ncbi:MAG: hypothetical protein Q8R95_06135 [Azonexus sp.]|nr:hypothetical protein [Azonexus sp.]